MQRALRNSIVATVSLAVLAAMPVRAADSGRGSGDWVFDRFAGWAEIDASGRLQAFELDGRTAATVVEALRDQLRQVPFQPARIDAVAVPVRTYLQGVLAQRILEGRYAMRLTTLQAGPKLERITLPEVPFRLLFNGEPALARASFVVGKDGKPREIAVEAADGSARKVVQSALRQWRFEPESIGGQPIETRLRQDFLFREERTKMAFPVCPPDASGRVLAPGQRACSEPYEMLVREGSPPRADPPGPDMGGWTQP